MIPQPASGPADRGCDRWLTLKTSRPAAGTADAQPLRPGTADRPRGVDQRCTGNVVPAAELTPPTLSVSGMLPSVTLAGTRTLI